MRKLNFEFGTLIVSILFALVFTVGLIVSIGVISEKNYCATMQELSTEVDYRWVFWGGCMVRMESGIWINAHQLNYNEVQLHGDK